MIGCGDPRSSAPCRQRDDVSHHLSALPLAHSTLAQVLKRALSRSTCFLIRLKTNWRLFRDDQTSDLSARKLRFKCDGG